MKNLATILFLLVSAFTISGCLGIPSREEIKQELEAELKPKIETQVRSDVAKEQKDFADYVEKNKKLTVIDAAPKEGESKLDALIREREETKGEIAKTKQEILAKQKLIDEGEGKIKALDASIKQAEQDRLKFWANLVGGISAGLAVVLAIAAFLTASYPLIPRVLRYAALGFGALSALSFGFAAIIPYLTAIGLTLGALIIGAGIFFWMRDRRSLGQVVEAVEKHKEEIPNYKEKFRQIIDTDVENHVGHLRNVIKKKISK